MRSLFIKIFLWFWLAHAMVIGAVMISSHWSRPPRDREMMDAILGDMIVAHAEKAITIAHHEGDRGLRRYLDDVARATGVRILLFDGGGGGEILGRPVPPSAREAVRRAFDAGAVRMDQPPGTPPLLARRILAPNGRRYVAVGDLPPGPFADWGVQPYRIVIRWVVVVSVAGIVCYGLALYLTGPLRKLRASARQLADGNLAVRVPSAVRNRRDEMGDLGRDFDFMAERVESLVVAQRRLLSDMSHELRSPLARLNVAVGLVRQRTGPDLGGLLDRMERDLQSLNDLIGRILTLARLKGGEGLNEQVRIDLAELVGELADDAAFEAKASNREVRLLRSDACCVTGTPGLLRSALENVVRNAILYTAEGTAVEISLLCARHDGGSRAVIRVRDHGPGVPEEAVADIFRPFCRIGEDRDRQTGGVGLGLAIAQQAMRLHNGTVSAANAPDGGLIVELTLPAAATPLQLPSPEPGT